jgi:hypothetical protein
MNKFDGLRVWSSNHMVWPRLVFCLVIVYLGGCTPQTRKSIFLQSPDEILESVRLLAQLDGGTKIRDYEAILGGNLVLTADESAGFIPLQSYRLANKTSKFEVILNIVGAADPNGPKTVRLNLLRINDALCIPMTKLKTFVSSNFLVLPPSITLGFNFTRLSGPKNPIVGASATTGDCVDTIGIFYNTLYSSPWGH